MTLIETWRETTISEGFARRRSLIQIARETGLSVRDVMRRAVGLNLIPARDAALLMPLPPRHRRQSKRK
jgi:hypothetical protein